MYDVGRFFSLFNLTELRYIKVVCCTDSVNMLNSRQG
jgi:hypothetical protein